MTDLDQIKAAYKAATEGCHPSFEFQRLQTAVAHIPDMVKEIQGLRERGAPENPGTEKHLLVLEMQGNRSGGIFGGIIRQKGTDTRLK